MFEESRELWIEVKSWSFKRIVDRTERRTAKRDFARKLINRAADEFRTEITLKFLGTTSYIAWSRLGIPETVRYVVFLEPPDRGSRPLLGPFQDRLRDQFKNAQARRWGRRIQFKVADLPEFQREFPDYPIVAARGDA